MEGDLPAGGWNLPPGVSVKDIDNHFGDNSDLPDNVPDDWFDNPNDDYGYAPD